MREYKLKSPGQSGGLVPLQAAVPAVVPVPLPAAPAPAPAPAGIPVRICGAGGGSAAPARGGRVVPAEERPHEYPADTGSRLLGAKERSQLGMLAGQAFAYMCQQDPGWLPDMLKAGHKKGALEDNWRHSQVRRATEAHPDGKAAGLKAAKRSQYRTIQAHFLRLMGKDVESINVEMRTGRAFGKAGKDGDRKEDCEQAMAVVREIMQQHPTVVPMGYVLKVCGGEDGTGGKFHTRNLESLKANQLWNLVYTLKNRIRAKLGKGDPDNRNKKQKANAPGRKKNRRDAEAADDRGPF